MSEIYQKVAYIGLRKEDGSVLIGIPLYIKLKDVQDKTTLKSQEEIIHNISEEMMKRYQQQFGSFIENKKQEKAKLLKETKSEKEEKNDNC